MKKTPRFSFPVKFTLNFIINNIIKFKKRKKKSNRGDHFPKPPANFISGNSGIVIDRELVINEILTRLPVKSLLRFKSVCKGWNSVIGNDQNFIDVHLTRSKSRNPSLFILVQPPKMKPIWPHPEILTAPVNLDLTISTIQSISTITFRADITTNSINGLICFVEIHTSIHDRDYLNHIIRLYNINTRQETKLPSPPLLMEQSYKTPRNPCLYRPMYQFGHDANDKYKLVCMWNKWSPKEHEFDQVCEIITIGGSVGWRRIDDPPHLMVNPSVYVNGSIYWSGRKLRHGHRWSGNDHRIVFIVAFDVGNEKFRTIPVPGFILDDCKCEDPNVDLLEVGGQVAIQIKVNMDIVKLWIYDDEKKLNTTTPESLHWSDITIKLPFTWLDSVCVKLHAISDHIIIKSYFYEDPGKILDASKEIKKMKEKQNVSFDSLDWRKNEMTTFEVRGIPPSIPTQYISWALFTTYFGSLLKV